MKSLIFLTHYFFLQKALGAAFVNLLLRERFAVNDNTLVLVRHRLIPIVLNCGTIEVNIDNYSDTTTAVHDNNNFYSTAANGTLLMTYSEKNKKEDILWVFGLDSVFNVIRQLYLQASAMVLKVSLTFDLLVF